MAATGAGAVLVAVLALIALLERRRYSAGLRAAPAVPRRSVRPRARRPVPVPVPGEGERRTGPATPSRTPALARTGATASDGSSPA